MTLFLFINPEARGGKTKRPVMIYKEGNAKEGKSVKKEAVEEPG